MAEHSDDRVRRETGQRVQVGLIGLGAVLLVVAFANIVAKARHSDALQPIAMSGQQPLAGASNATAPGSQSSDTEPFADLGVTPKADQSVSSGPVGPSVPDLEPDPRLNKPMDRDPQRPDSSPPNR